MKKKILSTLLAVCLFVGMAIPAVFAATGPKDTAKFDKTAIYLGVGANTIVNATYDLASIFHYYDATTGEEDASKLGEFTWKTSNPIIADVVGSVVTPKAAGTAVITATRNDKNYTCTVTVVAAAAPSSASISGPTSVVTGQKLELVANVPSSTPLNMIYAWTITSGTNLTLTAGTDAKSKVEYTADAVNATASVVKVTIGGTTERSANVTVKDVTLPTSVSLPAANFDMALNETRALPTVSFSNSLPGSTVNVKNAKFAIYKLDGTTELSGDYAVAEIKDGKITAKVAGSYILRAQAYGADNTTAIANVKADTLLTIGKEVYKAPAMSSAIAAIEVGKTSTLKVNNLKAGATVVWTTSDAKIATVKDGVVTAVAAGKATITATVSTGEVVTCAVTVNAAPVVKPVEPTKPTTNPQTSDSLFANLF